MNLPVFAGTERQKVSKIIDWLFKNIKTKKWTREEFEKKLFSRTPEQVISEGHVCYMFPCVDLCAVASELLLANGFKPTIVLDRNVMKGESGFHMAVEFLLCGKPVHLRIRRHDITIVGGFFRQTEKRPVVLKAQVSHSVFSQSYFSLFGVKNFTALEKLLGTEKFLLTERNLERMHNLFPRLNTMRRRAVFRSTRRIVKVFSKKRL